MIFFTRSVSCPSAMLSLSMPLHCVRVGEVGLQGGGTPGGVLGEQLRGNTGGVQRELLVEVFRTGISEGAGGMFSRMQGAVVEDEGVQPPEVAAACLIDSIFKGLWG